MPGYDPPCIEASWIAGILMTLEEMARKYFASHHHRLAGMEVGVIKLVLSCRDCSDSFEYDSLVNGWVYVSLYRGERHDKSTMYYRGAAPIGEVERLYSPCDDFMCPRMRNLR